MREIGKIYKVAALVFLLSASHASGVNYLALKQESTTLSMAIGGRVSLSEDDVQQSLRFLRFDEPTQPAYVNEGAFQDLCASKCAETENNPAFVSFTNLCRSVYAQSEPRDKMEVHLLFEWTSKKFIESLNADRTIAEYRAEREKKWAAEELASKISEPIAALPIPEGQPPVLERKRKRSEGEGDNHSPRSNMGEVTS